ncbi:uncharacterized protein LOC128767065 [Synchiropus splendidus]|uniref:uncharacterized protein LOC128767065 n=1 Tax=Synchiropus splendidus TaxID=270530 RepID=UPI00237EA203|nr:uncharacterized protein LOC128767065 [Synchiropus splendidus]
MKNAKCHLHPKLTGRTEDRGRTPGQCFAASGGGSNCLVTFVNLKCDSSRKGQTSRSCNPSNKEITCITLELEAEVKTGGMTADFRAALAVLETKFDQVQTTVEDHSQWLSSLEPATDDLSQRVSDIESTCSAFKEVNAKLQAKVVDLEGWSRRQNVRILGLAESTESGQPTEFFFRNCLLKFLDKRVSHQPRRWTVHIASGHPSRAGAATTTCHSPSSLPGEGPPDPGSST